MTPLPVLIVVFTVVAIASSVVLVLAAWSKPRSGALVERAMLSVLIAFFGVIYSIAALNTDLGQVILTGEVTRVLVRVAVIILLALPSFWTLLYLTGRLGDGK